MAIRLRGHHLLCLLGYRGMGYSPQFCDNMTDIYEQLREKPGTEIDIVLGPDDICRAYPDDGTSHCEGGVSELDAAVLGRLGFAAGDRIAWRDALAAVACRLKPDDIGRLCTTCPWEPYGVCSEGVRLVTEGSGLPPAPARKTEA